MSGTQRTTGQTISRLGVLTCLAFNQLEVNHVEEDERKKMLAEIELIVDGQAGVGARKVWQRSGERCAMAVFN